MRRVLFLLVTVTLSACGSPLERWESEVTDCDSGGDNGELVLLLERQLGQPLSGWLGFAGENSDVYVMAPLEDIDMAGGELTAETDFDLGNSATGTLTVEADLDGDVYEGDLEIESGGNTDRCDVELELQ